LLKCWAAKKDEHSLKAARIKVILRAVQIVVLDVKMETDDSVNTSQ